MLTGLGIRRLLAALRPEIEGSRLGKAWRSGDAWVFKISTEKGYLVARPGGFYLTDYAPRGDSTGFPMFLRKHVSGRVVQRVRQHKVDRVVWLEFGGSRLVFELFGKGNVIYEKGGEVQGAFRRSQRARRGEPYQPPESVDYLGVGKGEFVELVEGKDKGEVARELGIGRLVEEVWGEPDEIWEKLQAMAEEPLDPAEVEEHFRQEDRERLAGRRQERVRAEKVRLRKSMEEVEETIQEYEEKAEGLESAARAIMCDLPGYDRKLREAAKEGSRKLAVEPED